MLPTQSTAKEKTNKQTKIEYETNTITPTVTQALDINSVRMFLVLHG